MSRSSNTLFLQAVTKLFRGNSKEIPFEDGPSNLRFNSFPPMMKEIKPIFSLKDRNFLKYSSTMINQ